MLRKIRIVVASLVFLAITLLFLDITGALHNYLSWLAKIQFLPALLAVNLAVVIALVLVTLIFGRCYCSFICPLGIFQDLVSHIRVSTEKKKKHFSYRKECRWLRYGLLALFIVALVAGVQVFVALLAPYSSYGRIVQNLFSPIYGGVNNIFARIAERADSYAFYSKEVWIRSLPTFIIAAVTFVLVVVLAWRGGRTYCNSICPVGTILSFFSRFSLLRPVIDFDKCKKCRQCEFNCKASCIDIAGQKIDHSRCVDCFNCLDKCEFGALKYRLAYSPQPKGEKAAEEKPKEAADASRRAFMSSAVLFAGAAALKAQEKKLDGGLAEILPKTASDREIPVTPFGSKSVKDFYSRCTACQLCVSQCPNNVLRPSMDLKRLMQPEMSYERGYCRPECVTCSEVCPAGAITKITPEEKTSYRIGLAAVDRSLCVTEQGVNCGNCARHCPTGAIRMVPGETEDGRTVYIPTIMEEYCIGCGACENLCPSRPISAIRVNGRETHLKES